MFIGYFQYNSELIEEPYYEPTGGELLVESEWRITGYTYDANLTDQFIHVVGEYSPIYPIQVNWSVYKRTDPDGNPDFKEIKVFAQPKIKTTKQWVLVQEGEVDGAGHMQFYSYDALLKEKIM